MIAGHSPVVTSLTLKQASPFFLLKRDRVMFYLMKIVKSYLDFGFNLSVFSYSRSSPCWGWKWGSCWTIFSQGKFIKQ